MQNAMVFCVECGCKTQYSVSSSRENATVRGVTFSYVETHAHCKNCGSLVYVPEINDTNVLSREEGYRKAEKLITVLELRGLLEKYNIGAGPLSKLLGFGEITINRYIGGQLPSRKHSDILLQLRASHKMMDEYLEKGKDRITNVAYTKCREAIDRLSHLYGEGKIEIVTRYFLYKAVDITPMALQKLLYYAQAFFHALFHKDLFCDDCQAWAFGPVYPNTYYQYKDFGYNPIDKPSDVFDDDFDELTTKEISLLDAIIDSFGCYSGIVLSKITHNERPWIEARGSLQPQDRSETIIDRNTINEYFDSIVSQYQIVNPCDINKYCVEMLEHIR